MWCGVDTEHQTAYGRHPQRAGRSSFGHLVATLNMPNVLTTVRIVVIPVFLWLIMTSKQWPQGGNALEHRWWALVAFVALMFTDQLDGFLARKYEVVTDFGKLADPIADKALMISALVSLNILGDLWWWVTIVIVLREVGITVWRMVLARRGRVVPASTGGKLKTILQAAAVTAYIIPATGVVDWIGHVLMAAAVIVTVVSGLQYVLASQRQ